MYTTTKIKFPCVILVVVCCFDGLCQQFSMSADPSSLTEGELTTTSAFFLSALWNHSLCSMVCVLSFDCLAFIQSKSMRQSLELRGQTHPCFQWHMKISFSSSTLCLFITVKYLIEKENNFNGSRNVWYWQMMHVEKGSVLSKRTIYLPCNVYLRRTMHYCVEPDILVLIGSGDILGSSVM